MVVQKDLWAMVNSAKADIQLNSSTHDMTFFKWAGDCVQELNNYNIWLPSGKGAKLILDENNVAYLPDDCSGRDAIYKIGTCINGRMINFDINETLCLESRSACSCDEIQATITDTVCNTGWWDRRCHYFGYWESGQYVAGIYGAGAGFYRGGYRINDAERTIKFDEFVRPEYVRIEYRTDALLPNGNAYVPQILERPIKNFIHRERCTFGAENTGNKFQSQLLERQAVKFGQRYVNGFKAAVGQLKLMTLDQLLSSWRASITQVPKR